MTCPECDGKMVWVDDGGLGYWKCPECDNYFNEDVDE